MEGGEGKEEKPNSNSSVSKVTKLRKGLQLTKNSKTVKVKESMWKVYVLANNEKIYRSKHTGIKYAK